MIERSTISSKIRNMDYYLQAIENLGWIEFDCLTVVSTAGEIRPPYNYQWRAVTKIRPGIDDEPFEGIGGTTLEAVRDLYKSLKEAEQETMEDEEF